MNVINSAWTWVNNRSLDCVCIPIYNILSADIGQEQASDPARCTRGNVVDIAAIFRVFEGWL